MELYQHQKQVLSDTERFNRVGYFLDMGLGKTFVGSEKNVGSEYGGQSADMPEIKNR